jgi:hypothetical protein
LSSTSVTGWRRPSEPAIRPTTARSVLGPCSSRQLRPTTSSYDQPVSRVNEGFTQTSGSSGRRGSVMVNDISVATTARSRSTCSRLWSGSSGPDSCWKTTSARSASPTSAPLSGHPVAQSRRPSAVSRCCAVAVEPRRAASCTAIGSPFTGTPPATSDSGELVSLIRRPPRSVRPAASLQRSMSTGRRSRLPVSSIAAGLA